MLICLPEEAMFCLNMIKKYNYNAYVVGGFVRDCLLGIKSYDIDITTNATPIKIKEIFNNYKIDDTYIDYGCIKFKYSNYNFEITTFRKDFEYVNYRKPRKIEYTSSIDEDLKRRDFTINALCSDGFDFLDLFDGMKDLNNRLINAIGDPYIRLEEDALRILRALRFSSKLGFSIEFNLKRAINKLYVNLKDISFTKKYSELKGILDGRNYLNVLKENKSILMHIFDLDDLAIELFSSEMNYQEKEALFFYYSNNNIDNKFLKYKKVKFDNSKIDLKKKLSKMGKENISNLLYFRSVVLKEDKDAFNLLNEIIDNNECYNLKMLSIKGKDLLNIGLESYKIGESLNCLLEAVIEGKCNNDKEELLRYLKNILRLEG